MYCFIATIDHFDLVSEVIVRLSAFCQLRLGPGHNNSTDNTQQNIIPLTQNHHALVFYIPDNLISKMTFTFLARNKPIGGFCLFHSTTYVRTDLPIFDRIPLLIIISRDS